MHAVHRRAPHLNGCDNVSNSSPASFHSILTDADNIAGFPTISPVKTEDGQVARDPLHLSSRAALEAEMNDKGALVSDSPKNIESSQVENVSSTHQEAETMETGDSSQMGVNITSPLLAKETAKAEKRPKSSEGREEASTDEGAKKQKPLRYKEIPRIDASKYSSEELRKIACDMPICFITGLTDSMKSEVFTMEHMKERYGSTQADILLQSPDSFGFPVEANVKVDGTVKDYIDYAQRLEREVTEEQKKAMNDRVFKLMSGEGNSKECSIAPIIGRKLTERNSLDIKFCVNLDAGSFETVVEELEKLPAWCKWGSHDSVLRCLPKNLTVPGLSLPQLYLKVPGVWTGGHEENLRIHSINNNHGPGNSVWGAIAPEYVVKFREAVLSKKRCNIYDVEGRWFPDLDFCAENGIPVMIGVQRPGDTAILNGATLHWVRSGGFAVNSSWNFGVRSAKQMDLAFQRDYINYQLGVRNIVPLRSLGVEILKDFRNRFPGPSVQCEEEYKFIEHVLKRLLFHNRNQEDEYVKAIRLATYGKKKNRMPLLLEPEGALVLICDNCWREVVHHYVVCQTCAEDNHVKGVTDNINLAKPVFFCPPCGIEHANSEKKRRHCLEARFKCIEDGATDFRKWILDWQTYFQQNVKCAAASN